MKSCPTCDRTFGNEMVFCLVDGSILSAPFDPQATAVLPRAKPTEPAEAVLARAESVSEPPLASPIFAPADVDVASTSSAPRTTSIPVPTHRKRWVALAVVLLVTIGAVFLYRGYMASQCSAMMMSCFTSGDATYCRVKPVEDEIGLIGSPPSPPMASMNSLAFYQQRLLPASVKTEWVVTGATTRSDIIDDEMVKVETEGLEGRVIQITVHLKGVGSMCQDEVKMDYTIPAK